MPLGIQLDLDPESNRRLVALAERLDAIPGLETVRRLGDVHHLSLGIHDGEPTPALESAIALFAARTMALDIRIAAIGVFPGAKSVLYLAPVTDTALLALHRAFHDAVAGVAPPVRDHYLPRAWVPHVSLALDVTPEALPLALETVRAAWQPMTARLAAVRLIRFFPVETLALNPLSRP